MKKTLIIGFCLLSSFAHAKKFKNSYIEFELPPKWDCQPEHTEWICRNSIVKKEVKKQAVIIFTAKEVGVADTMSNYKSHLKKIKMISDLKGKPISSTVKHVTERKMNNHSWVDGLHLNSEVPMYYTRYLATIKQRIAILVTFSAHQRYYTKYVNDFIRSIESLRITASGSLLQGSIDGGGALGSGFGGLGLDALEEDFPEEPHGSSGIGQKILILAILLVLIGAYFAFFRRRKKNK